MVFRNFHIRLIFRILLITLSLLLVCYCLPHALYLRSVYAGVLSVLLISELFFFISRFTRNITNFLESVQERDFTIHFAETKSNSLLNKLYASLNRLTEVYKKISVEKEIKQRYLETLIEHISFGIVSCDEQGNVRLVNQAFLKQATIQHLHSIHQLAARNKPLYDALRTLEPGKKKLLKLTEARQLVTLSLFSTEFKLDNTSFTLISVQNISHELSTTEIEAWQRLIKVLTHEIMNSIAPILSLSGTLHEISKGKAQATSAEWDTLSSGLEAINIRSAGLLSFTQRYRELTQLPSPVFKNVNIKDLIEQVLQLIQSDLNMHSISVVTELKSVQAMVDASLMEQVLLNIIRNAMDALEGINNPLIHLQLTAADDRIYISIKDNGAGIATANLDKIFVPFFTTKRNGSGIGLALSRQIALLHGGEIFVQSEVEKGSTFTIVM